MGRKPVLRCEGRDHVNTVTTHLKGKTLTPTLVEKFRRLIYDYFRRGRREMPWRQTSDPYRILVSEIMLQQTRVERVEAKYPKFIEAFPDFRSLARASLREILRVWQGMGYNRRVMALQKIARRVVTDFHGRLPDSEETLRTFPGIGPATAGAVAAFAFNKPSVFVETNIRRAFLDFFFADRDNVSDKEILPIVEKTLDRENPRLWYYALMDYGAILKNDAENANRRSAHYTRQSPFEGSDRQIRSLILKTLLANPRLSVTQLLESVGKRPKRTERIMTRLGEEGFLVREGDLIWISPGQGDDEGYAEDP
jgi:A/G-specific adenine glycosylase